MARKDKEKSSVQVKVPKGTRDWDGSDMAIRQFIFSTIEGIFKKHGAVSIDTPVFELKSILTDKYGEDSKLIYDLADQGGEITALRYDLTVPFARYLAMTGIQQMKRYHIAKVYRRDQPAMTKGRMREFYQCDIDIAGTYDPMLPDAEVLRMAVEVFTALGWPSFTIKLNHRRILDGMFRICGVPEDKIRTISSAVDKLDKLPWVDVKKEMLEKGLAEESADRIRPYTELKGSRDVLEKLKADSANEQEDMKEGITQMELLFDYLDAFQVTPHISFDLSLARGLDYYTGCIWEIVTEESRAPAVSAATNGEVKKERARKEKKVDEDADRSDDPTVGVGSVAAGGRYDNLVGAFCSKPVPCTGISFGIDRIFAVISKRLASQSIEVPPSETKVLVMVAGGELVKERMEVLSLLWDAGVPAEMTMKVKPRWDKQFKDAERAKIPLSVIMGEEEVRQGVVKLKVNGLPAGHPEKEGVLVKKEELAKEVGKRLAELEDQSLAARLSKLSAS